MSPDEIKFPRFTPGFVKRHILAQLKALQDESDSREQRMRRIRDGFRRRHEQKLAATIAAGMPVIMPARAACTPGERAYMALNIAREIINQSEQSPMR